MSSYNPFYDDVKERNSVKNGAFHRVNGSKSKTCSLPSDNLTPAQKRKMNGPMREWNVRAPMKWHDFKKMPIDLQQEHLDFIQRTFFIGATSISKEVFGLSKDGLPQHMKAHGLKLSSLKGCRPPIEDLRAWLSGEEYRPITEEPAKPAVVNAPEEVSSEAARPAFVVNQHIAHISGTASDLLTYISAMLGGRNADVRIEINFKEEMNNEK